MTSTTADREIIVTRLIDAPRDLVFSAFTEREHVEKWWIPNGMTHEWNAQPGGLWRFSQAGPDGAQFPFKIEFIELTRPTQIVYDFGTDAENAPDPVRTVVTFEEESEKTRVTLKLVHATGAARQEAEQYGAAAGAQQALADLADYLADLSQ